MEHPETSTHFDLNSFDEPIKSIGDYEFDPKAKLGEGAYGSVFRGRRVTSGLSVAIKIVSSDRVKDDELESISAAQSSCVVRLLEVLKNDQLTYIVTELCDTDLEAFLSQYSRLDDHNLTVLARCLAEGYLILHRHGIVHRDIKPQNILLQLDSSSNASPEVFMNGTNHSPRRSSQKSNQPAILVAKFADFGCSRLKKCQNGEDAPANCAGTFSYMAPEVGANLVNSYRYDEAVDMWSIGIVLYQAIMGHVPFTEQQLCRLFLRAVDQNYTAYVPPSLDDDDLDASLFKVEKPQARRLSKKCKSYQCHKHYGELISRLLQLDPSNRMSPLQFHAYAAHDRPSSFLRCLTEGSCSDTQSSGAMTSKKLATMRRTASGVFNRLKEAVNGCRM